MRKIAAGSNMATCFGEAIPSINADRLWARHMEMAAVGPVGGTGNCRLALSPEDAAARDLFAKWCREAGMAVRCDRAGNVFAIRPGRDAARGAIAAGSHLDTQPHGGRFDGVSGVLAALEVVDSLNDAGIETEAPIMVVNWTNEEGVRFAPGMLGSAWFAGRIDDATLDGTVATDGRRFADEVEAIGWRGTASREELRIAEFFELHIEQGPVLEASGSDVGIVTTVQGLCWLDVEVVGADAHAGTTPLDTRRDALLAAASMLVGINDVGRSEGAEARISVGRLSTATEGPSTVVGRAEFVIDIRHPQVAALARLRERCRRTCEELAVRYHCHVEVTERFAIPPTQFDEACVEALEEAARSLQIPYRKMASGALHDAANMASIVPSAMVFVPCRDGISHNVAEYASKEQLAAGCNVLLRAMLARAR
jgi:N-carbamoyl-L-amino-acid hydrolase